MKSIYPVLRRVKSLLSTETQLKSIKIGLEKGADTAKNAPFCRIVVEAIEFRGILCDVIIQLVFGMHTKNNYEALYEEFFEMESNIRNLLFKLPYKVEIIETIIDEDRLLTLKAGIIRVKIGGINAD